VALADWRPPLRNPATLLPPCLVGRVIKVGTDYVGLLVLGVFNAAIGAERIRREFKCSPEVGQRRGREGGGASPRRGRTKQGSATAALLLNRRHSSRRCLLMVAHHTPMPPASAVHRLAAGSA
jgi:hypothetical protein